MPLLTVIELRKHLSGFPTGDDNDDVLRRLLEAAEAAITEAAGPLGAVTEFYQTDSTTIFPSRPVSSVTSITETVGATVTTLAANDYFIWPGGWIIERLTSGTNPRGTWTGDVRLIYSAASDVATREMVQVQLCQQFVNYNPALTSETVGDWAQTFASNSVFNWAIERDNILAQLGGRGVVIA